MIVDDLWRIWNKVYHKGILRTHLHFSLQEEIKRLAPKYSYLGRHEYGTPHELGIKGKGGLVDVVWLNPDTKQPEIAFEIDSARRDRSILKLLDMDVKERYWLYYGSFHNIKSFVEKYDKEQKITIIRFPNYKITSYADNNPYDEAKNIIRIRYAKGEITKEQFEQMKKDLENFIL